MGTLTNILKTVFTSTGADSVVKETDHLSRAQTRLGQASVGNSRQFAAQASGLGGLVAAYAGAAATMFAIQAAFDALNKAAQSETMIKGTNTLAANLSQSGPSILKSIQDITQGQLTLTEASQNANIALSAGFSSKQLEGFTEVAMKASRALGRDLSDSMQRVVKGVAKLEPELLDELGIFTRIEPAVQKYAKQLGVSTKSLTEFQRRQAFANAAIEEGLRKFSNIDTTSSSSQKSLERLRVEISQLATDFTKMLVTVATPIINFFSGDIGNSLLLFGGILAMVFSKSMQIIETFASNSIQRLDIWAGSFVDKTKIATDAIKKLQKEIAAPLTARTNKAGEAILGGGLSGIRTKAYAGQSEAQAKAFKEALTMQRENINLSVTDLTRIKKAYQDQLATIERVGSKESASYKNLQKAIENIDSTLTKGGKSVQRYMLLTKGLEAAARGLTLAFSVLGTVLNGVFMVIGIAQLVGTLFDIDILGAVKDYFVDISQAAEDLKNGIAGVALAAGGGSDKIVKSLQQIGISAAAIEKLPDTIRSTAEAVKQAARASSQPPSSWIDYIGMGAGAGAATGLAQIEAQQAKVKLTDTDLLVAAQKKLLSVQQEIAQTSNSEDLENLKMQEEILGVLVQKYSTYGVVFDRLFGQISSITGLSAEKTAQIFTDIRANIEGTGDSMLLFGQRIKKVNGEFNMLDLAAGSRKFIELGTLATNSTYDITNAMKSGAVTSQYLGASLGGLQENLSVLQVEYNTNTARIQAGVGATKEAIEANNNLGTAIAGLKNDLDVFKQIEADIINLERVYKGITSTFSKEISLFDTAQFDGLISATGDVAANQKEINNNQAAYLKSTIEATKWAADLYNNEEALNTVLKNNNLTEAQRLALQAELQIKSDIYNKSMAAANGKILSIIQSAQDLSSQYDAMTANIIADISTLKQEGTLIKLNVEIDKAQLSREIALANEQAKLERLQLQVELVAAKEDNKSISKSDAAVQTNSLEQDILNQRRVILDIEHANNIANITDRNRILLAEYELAKNKIIAESELQKQKILADAANITNLISVYEGFITAQNESNQNLTTGIVSAATSAAAAWATTFTNGAAAIAQAISTGTAGTVAAGVAGPVDVAAVTANLKTAGEALDYSTAKLIGTVTEQRDLQIQAEKDKANAAILHNNELITAENNAYGNKIANLAIEKQIEDETAKSRIAAANAGSKEISALDKKLMQLFDSIKGHIETAIMGLNNLLFYGEGNFGDIMGNLFKSIQQDFFKQTIAQPLSDALTTGLFGMFGVNVGAVTTKGERGLTYEGNSLLVKVVNAGDFGIGGALTGANDPNNPQATGVVGWMSKLFGKDGTVSGFFSNLFGEGGILSNLLSGFGSFLGSIFKAIFGGIFGGGGMFGGGKVTGGIMHMAQGGVAGSSALRRDRIPALLEPGEFVVRKPVARMVGTPALNSLNATGRMPNGGAPTINLVNEGSPKDVQQAKPRFDGEKYVIDIILRDLSNNGPIRRSLRGGSS